MYESNDCYDVLFQDMVEYIVFFGMLYLYYFILLIAERQVHIISAIVIIRVGVQTRN